MLVSINLIAKISILTLIQMIPTVYLFIVRPYDLVKDLIFECMSQTVVTLISGLLIFYSTEDKWSSITNWIIIGIIMISSLIGTIVSLIDLTIMIIKKTKRWCSNDKIENFRNNQDMTASRNGPDFANAIAREFDEFRISREENKSTFSDNSKSQSDFPVNPPSISTRRPAPIRKYVRR